MADTITPPKTQEPMSRDHSGALVRAFIDLAAAFRAAGLEPPAEMRFARYRDALRAQRVLDLAQPREGGDVVVAGVRLVS